MTSLRHNLKLIIIILTMITMITVMMMMIMFTLIFEGRLEDD